VKSWGPEHRNKEEDKRIRKAEMGWIFYKSRGYMSTTGDGGLAALSLLDCTTSVPKYFFG
jgi:hypothetical protein